MDQGLILFVCLFGVAQVMEPGGLTHVRQVS